MTRPTGVSRAFRRDTPGQGGSLDRRGGAGYRGRTVTCPYFPGAHVVKGPVDSGLPALVLLVVTLVVPPRALAQRPGAESGWQTIALPETVAAVVGLASSSAADRARLVPEAVRRLHHAPPGRLARGDQTAARLQTLAAVATAAGGAHPRRDDAWRVPVPLPSHVWTDTVLRRPVPDDRLLAAILADRHAALLAYGFSALDAETLAALAAHPSLVARLARRAPGLVAAFARSLVIRGGRVQVPGGEPARPLWEQAVGARTTEPDRFIAALFELEGGRIAYLYDAVAALDDRRARFALGLWLPEATRAERWLALVRRVAGAYRTEWHPEDRPFSRVTADVAWLLAETRVDADGRPAPPAWAAVWEAVFRSAEVGEADPVSPADLADAELVDAERLLALVNVAAPAERVERVATFVFGQRVFAGATAAEAADLVAALRGRRRFPMLAAALERAGVRTPSLYAAAARRAAAIAALDPARAEVALREFQGALGLVVRLAETRAVEATTTERLVRTLVDAPLRDGRYDGAVAAWVRTELLPVVTRTADAGSEPGGAPTDRDAPLERTLLAAVSGAGSRTEAARLRPVVWEGVPYRLDIVGTELARLEAIRRRQGGATLDEALAVAGLAARRRDHAPSASVLASIAAELRALAERLHAPKGVLLPDRGGWPDPSTVLEEAAASTAAAAGRPRDDLRRARTALTELADALLGDVLASIAYAIALGDAESRAVRGSNVARRHDFGLARPEARGVASAAWRLPEPQVVPGAPWHVRGALLNLDVGLAEFALRRVDVTDDLRAPVLASSERRALAESVALLNVFDLTDRDRDALARAAREGARRVREAARDPDRIAALAAEARVDAWRRQQLVWLASHDPDGAPDRVTLGELVQIGHPPPDVPLDAWGASAVAANGCLCLRFAAPLDWASTTGRPEAGLLASRLPDLTLRVAVLLAELDLPAALGRGVLAAAAQAFVDRVDPAHPDDWPALARAAAAVTRDEVEDYVAALAASGPLVPESAAPGRGAPAGTGVR